MLIQKSTLETKRLVRFENNVLLDFAFTHKYIHIYTQKSNPGKNNILSGYIFVYTHRKHILGKIISFEDILFTGTTFIIFGPTVMT